MANIYYTKWFSGFFPKATVAIYLGDCELSEGAYPAISWATEHRDWVDIHTWDPEPHHGPLLGWGHRDQGINGKSTQYCFPGVQLYNRDWHAQQFVWAPPGILGLWTSNCHNGEGHREVFQWILNHGQDHKTSITQHSVEDAEVSAP